MKGCRKIRRGACDVCCHPFRAVALELVPGLRSADNAPIELNATARFSLSVDK
jgi:hypothetical protein